MVSYWHGRTSLGSSIRILSMPMRILSILFEVIQDHRRLMTEINLLGIWSKLTSDSPLLFSKLMERLAEKHPWTHTNMSEVLQESEMQVRFIARFWLKKVSAADQLLHMLSPGHIDIHPISHLGISAHSTNESTLNHATNGGTIHMSVGRDHPLETCVVSFMGPLLVRTKRAEIGSIVFMLVPLEDEGGHILELVYLAPQKSEKAMWLDIVGLVITRAPIIAWWLFGINYVEDAPFYRSERQLGSLTSLLKECLQCPGDNPSPNHAFQWLYGRQFQEPLKTCDFALMFADAARIGSSLFRHYHGSNRT